MRLRPSGCTCDAGGLLRAALEGVTRTPCKIHEPELVVERERQAIIERSERDRQLAEGAVAELDRQDAARAEQRQQAERDAALADLDDDLLRAVVKATGAPVTPQAASRAVPLNASPGTFAGLIGGAVADARSPVDAPNT